MATPQNRRNTKVGQDSGTAKKNYTALYYGNDHGSISFGHISKQGDTTSDVLIQGSEGTHQISLDKDGPRAGWTSVAAPKNIQIDCGKNNVKDQETFIINAENGNINIVASNGKIKFVANDIEFDIKGNDGTEGNFAVFASENVSFDCKKFQVNAKTFYKLATPGTAEIACNTVMKMYAPIIRGVTDAVSRKDSKVGGKKIWNENQS